MLQELQEALCPNVRVPQAFRQRGLNNGFLREPPVFHGICQ